LSGLLLFATFLWLFRCAFVLSVDLKSIIPDWTTIELSAQKIVYPILDFWVSATVLGFVTFILRNPALCDPSAMPEHPPEQQPQVYVQYVPVGYYPQPQYGQQPQMYQQYPQHYPQQPGQYQQHPPELPPTPMTANRVYEADAAQPPAELRGIQTPQLAR
jgi:hypothetical protein